MSVPLKVTAVLAVHNEETLIRGALESLASVADEILVAHDGPCRDASLEIAREFTPHVWVHEWRGAPEINLIQLLRRASHDWIVRLDCDEKFSPELRERLLQIKSRGGDEGVTHYKAIWRAIYDESDHAPPRPHEEPGRVVMFRKSCTRWLGIPHSPAVTTGRSEALLACIHHYAPHQQYSMRELLAKKLAPFAKVDAALRVKHGIEVFGWDDPSIEEVIRPIDRWRSKRPLVVAGPLAVLSCARGFASALRAGSSNERARNLRWPLAHGAYQLMLAWEIHRLRRAGFSPHLASASPRAPEAPGSQRITRAEY